MDLSKSVGENASLYYEKAKKFRKKIRGAENSIILLKKKLAELESKKDIEMARLSKRAEQRKREWYEKFRWFISSDGFLVIGGRDATSNEILIKKHAEKNDMILHTDMAGSPFFIIKSNNQEIPETTLKETADAVCTFSRAWKLNLKTSDVFYVAPEQVSKQAKAGEYLKKGSFMIYGKTNYIENKINLAIGLTKDNLIMSGPLNSIKKHCSKYVALKQGNEKISSIAKKIRHKLNKDLNLDDIIKALPSGKFRIVS